MSTREEEEHGCEAIIKALMKALMDIKGSPMDSLKPPTFDWNSLEQFEDFWLFINGMESWHMLQGTPDKAGDTTRLEYQLNFLGPIGQKKHEQWNPLAQLQRNGRRTRRVPSSLWNFYTAP